MNEFIELKPVNEIPTVPLSELQTGQMFGYTGTGDLKKVSTNELLGFIKSGNTGFAKEGNSPTPYDAVTYPDGLYESYKVVEPVTTTSAWYAAASTEAKLKFPITQLMLDANSITFDVTNGVVEVFLQPSISGKSAYELAVANGSFVGTLAEYLISLKGADGKNIIPEWETSTKIFTFSAGNPLQTIHLGKIWQNNATTGAGDIPGISSKWTLVLGKSEEITMQSSNYNETILEYFPNKYYNSQGVLGSTPTLVNNLGYDSYRKDVTGQKDIIVSGTFGGDYKGIYALDTSGTIIKVFFYWSNSFSLNNVLLMLPTGTKYIATSVIAGGVVPIFKLPGIETITFGEALEEVYDNWKIDGVESLETVTPMLLHSGYYFNTSYGSLGNSADTKTYLYPVNIGEKIKVSGYFGELNGIVVLNKDKQFISMIAKGSGSIPGSQLLDYELDGTGQPESAFYYAFSPYFNSGAFVVKRVVAEQVKTNAKELLAMAGSGGGGGGITILSDRTIYLGKRGLKESNSEATNTAIFNTAIAEARQLKCSIEIPEGIFKVSNIDLAPVHITGKDRNTVLQSASANPIFKMPLLGGANVFEDDFSAGQDVAHFPGMLMAGFCMDGANIGTKGFDFGVLAWSRFDRLVFANFTDVAINTQGTLICDFNDVHIFKCANGVIADKGTYNTAVYDANLVTFQNCRMNYIPGICIDWNSGAALHLIGLDTELCGTNGDNNTGVVKYSTFPWGIGEQKGVSFERCWAERNTGGFYFQNNTSAICSIRDSVINGASASIGVHNNQTNGRILIDNSHVRGYSTCVKTETGAKTIISGFNEIDNHTESGTGTYKVANFT